MPVTTPLSFFREGSIYVLVKTSDEPLPSAPGNLSTRTIGGSFFVTCDPRVQCIPSLSTEITGYVAAAYQHWIDIMQLSVSEYPLVNKEISVEPITNNPKDNCFVSNGFFAFYAPKTQNITVCAFAKGSIYSNVDIKETLFHEMFHATQWGIAEGSKLSKDKFNSLSSYLSNIWIIEGIASAAANSDSIWIVSKNHKNKQVNSEMYSINKSQNRFEFYRAHDFWISSLLNVAATKDLFKVNSTKKYSNTDLDYNANLVSDFFKSKGYAGGLREAYWKWVKSQALELNKDFLKEGNPCEISRVETADEIAKNSVLVDFDATFIKKDPIAIAKIPPTLNATPLTTRLWNFTFSNVPEKRFIHFKLSSSQPNAKFHVYKLPKNLPANYTACQDPTGLNDYADPQDVEVDNETRVVVLGSNLEYVNPADLKLEMRLPKPVVSVEPSTIYIQGIIGSGFNAPDQIISIQNIGDVHSKLEYKVYTPGTHPDPNPSISTSRPLQTRAFTDPAIRNGFPAALGSPLLDTLSLVPNPKDDPNTDPNGFYGLDPTKGQWYFDPVVSRWIFNPSNGVLGEITKENDADFTKDQFLVSGKCPDISNPSNSIDINYGISILSKTGEVLPNGQPKFALNSVQIKLTCLVEPPPPPPCGDCP